MKEVPELLVDAISLWGAKPLRQQDSVYTLARVSYRSRRLDVLMD
jgi:hypothetical protein